MGEKGKVSRRKFFVRGGLGAIGLVAIGTYVFRNPLRRMGLELAETIIPPYAGSGTDANLWFEITKDNRIIVRSPKVEMGQGIFTGIAQIVADELDVEMDQIQVIGASTDTGVIDALSTGGSLSVASLWMPVREMAATMREMIKGKGAQMMGLAVDILSTKAGVVEGEGKSMTYAEIAGQAGEWTIPETPILRNVSSYAYVGKPSRRVDLESKVFGDPIFGMDAELPDMLHACVIRPEHIGARFGSADIREAENMRGVVKVLQFEDWVGVVASSASEALAAKQKIKVAWEVPRIWKEEDILEMLVVGEGNEMITQKQGSALDENDEGVISMEFRSPIGAHAQIEPNGAVASVKDGKATIIISTQVVSVTRKQVAEALGFDLENVNVIPTYLGGGFGRRLNTPHAVRAARMSLAVGKPVKYFFSRKEEFQHDTFRPPTHHIMRGKLRDDGLLDGIEHHYASGDVAVGSVIMPPILHQALGTDIGAMRGANIMYDQIPNHRAVQWHRTLPFATSWWRSLGLLANTFAIESFMDEMALKADKNPFEFRISQIGDEGSGPRIKRVIQEAYDRSNYSETSFGGRALGMAASIDTGSPAAHVVEVSVENNEIRVHKVLCVFDCGLVVNPDQVKAQCEGAIVMGMSAAMYEKMTIVDGQLYPTIYGPYDMVLMKNAPREIEVILVEGADRPFPVGEPPMGPIGAAVANAVRRLTGTRLTSLPLSLNGRVSL